MESLYQRTLNKEQLYGIKFRSTDVLTTPQERDTRKRKLLKALTLGNIYKQHVKLRFKNAQNHILQTEATIWAITEFHVILKSHVMIPIRSITDVSYA